MDKINDIFLFNFLKILFKLISSLLSELENVAFDVQDKMDDIEARTDREVTDG